MVKIIYIVQTGYMLRRIFVKTKMQIFIADIG